MRKFKFNNGGILPEGTVIKNGIAYLPDGRSFSTGETTSTDSPTDYLMGGLGLLRGFMKTFGKTAIKKTDDVIESAVDIYRKKPKLTPTNNKAFKKFVTNANIKSKYPAIRLSEEELAHKEIMNYMKNKGISGYKTGGKFTFKNGGLIGQSNPTVRMFKHGGIIVGGVLHSQKNEIGDKGVPVVPVESFMKEGGKYNKNTKIAEIEAFEAIFSKETSDELDKLVDEYNDCKCPGKLLLLGQLIYNALKNTTDETCRTACEYKPKLDKLK